MDKINIVDPNAWGVARIEDIKKVLESVIDVFCDYWGPAVKWHNKSIKIIKPPQGYSPMCSRDTDTIYLTATDRYWSQYAYQFAHEYCHYCIYRPITQRFRWFEESLCEMSSYFVLNELSRRWAQSPPYYNWKDYAPNLSQYMLDDMKKAECINPESAEFHDSTLAYLEKHEYDRTKNANIAVRMLPIFESRPELWSAVPIICSCNDETMDFCRFMEKWHSDVPIGFKEGIRKIAEVFAIKV